MGLWSSIKKLGRWTDKTVLQSPYAGVAMPALLGYQAAKRNGLFSFLQPPKTPGLPGQAPAPPDLTDQAIQDAKRRELLNPTLTGGRRSAFLSGPLGDQSKIPTLTKSILG
jgi:hypothetical protein